MTVSYAKDLPSGFSNRIERVAIVGAGGQIGKFLTEHLVKTGKHIITAITRPESTSTLPDGVNIVRVDYSSDDDTTLVNALCGQQALVITMAVTAPRDTSSKLIRAAAKAGVPYILPNYFGPDAANDSLCTDSFLAERRDAIVSEITTLGVSSYFLLVCNFWYEFSLGGGSNRYGFDFTNNTLVLFDGGNVRINTTTFPQCGRAVAALLSLKELPDDENDKSPTLSQFRNSPVYISSFCLTQLDMFKSVKRVTGTTDADWTITHESAKQRWEEGKVELLKGNFGAFVKTLYSRIFVPGTGDGDYESSRGTHNDMLGLPVEDLNEATRVAVRMGKNGEVDH
ncbi:hypothetical protein B0T16DRAFT_317078 [Cercophora newfieldiana]|uniref:NmrA-like domain-containing protein n=1 Tax=Cercophora newfieldiana TaxID=92897 RepID=A0AA39YSQ6_9PEZI|nr:hypothetical protein B0T16DRAFT_317078 [Cercophora newfieldiana]